MSAPAPTRLSGLLLFSGDDKSGQSDSIFTALSSYAISIVDIEQVVIKGRLLLTVLIESDPAHSKAIEREMNDVAHRLGLDFAVEFTESEKQSRSSRSELHVVVLGSPLLPEAIAAVAHAIASHSGNIQRIHRTVSYPVTAFDLEISVDPDCVSQLKGSLARVSLEKSCDIAMEASSIRRSNKRLVLLDVDSTFIQQEVIDLLAQKAGRFDEVSSITDQAMRGEIDFSESLAKRVSLLKDLPEHVIDEVRELITLSPGAKTLVRTLHHLGHKVGVVSGGFIQVIQPLADTLQLDFVRANTLSIRDGVITGELHGPIIDRSAKAQALRDFATQESIPLSQTVAVGDGANDIDMLTIAGLGIAFNGKPLVKKSADSSISNPYLDSVIYLLGIDRETVQQAVANP